MVHSWMPHGYCFNWEYQILIPWIIGNLGTWICYVIIPVLLFRHGCVVYSEHPKLRHLCYWFSAFIVSCGSNHFLHVWTLWRSDYMVEAVMQLITFVVSVGAIRSAVTSLPRTREEVIFVIKEKSQDDGPERARAASGIG